MLKSCNDAVDCQLFRVADDNRPSDAATLRHAESAEPRSQRGMGTDHFHHIEQENMGEGGHFFQEDHPAEIGAVIVDWLTVVPAN